MNKISNVCIYCGDKASTKDHVPPKCFLDKPYPENLRTVPACRNCNNSFSSDEEFAMYLADYLSSIEHYNGEFTRQKAEATFNYNNKLEDRMLGSLKCDAEGNVFFGLEHERLNRIIGKVALGLLFLEYGSPKLITISNFIPVSQLTPPQALAFGEIKWIVVQNYRFQYAILKPFIVFLINSILYCVVQYE